MATSCGSSPTARTKIASLSRSGAISFGKCLLLREEQTPSRHRETGAIDLQQTLGEAVASMTIAIDRGGVNC